MELQEALATIELLHGQVAALEAQVRERDDALRESRSESELLRFENDRLRRALYGDKSERFVDDGRPAAPADPPRAAANDTVDAASALVAEAEGDDTSAVIPDAGEDGEPLWPRRRGKVREHERSYGPRRRKHLEVDPARVTDEHRHLYPDDTRCRCCGERMSESGEETSTRVEREPVRFRRVITHRHKMACSSCRRGGVAIARADDPPTFGAGMVGTSLAVDLVLMHYDDHLPFHRMARTRTRPQEQTEEERAARAARDPATDLARVER